jgi:hypothetical protein
MEVTYTIDRALDVGLGKGVGAAWARLDSGIALEENVETVAELLAVTEDSTSFRVVGVEGLVGQVPDLLSRAGSVGERLGVAGRSLSSASSRPELVVAVEVFDDGTIDTGNRSKTTHTVSQNARRRVFDIDLPCGLGGTSITFLKLNTTCSDGYSSGLRGCSLVVGHGKLSGLLGLGTKYRRGGNGQSSLDVDHLGKGSSQPAKGGSSNEDVSHVGD